MTPDQLGRRAFLRWVAWLPWLPATVRAAAPRAARADVAAPTRAATPFQPAAARLRPTDPEWPNAADWDRLRQSVHGRLVPIVSPWQACRAAPGSDVCGRLFAFPANPYALGDDIALTQTFGWVGAWASQPSVWGVAARDANDVIAAVNFAREHRLRLVVKGGGHSYQGTSNAADSLLVWTRAMNEVKVLERFVPSGCTASTPVRAVSVGAGAVWSHVYDAVTTKGGGYVQGGGCMTVGVAGLVQSGGFGSFSKAFGLAAGSLLEADVVTADGTLRTVNACSDPDLFWALKGGGGGNFGVVTRLVLRVHPLPETFGAVNFTVRAASDVAYRKLIATILDFCRSTLVDSHWGEQLRFIPGNVLDVSMVFQGLSRSEAKAAWQPFFDAVDAAGADLHIDFAPLKIVATDARTFWSPTLIKRLLGFIKHDDRPGAPEGNVFWPGDHGQAGQFLYAYESAWLPASLLEPSRRDAFADALFAATRHWRVSLHLNKGLAGATARVLAEARDTAMNPAVLDAFALAILGAGEQPAYPGIDGHEPDIAGARRAADALGRAFVELRKVVPNAGAYLAESNFFQADWQRAFWGANAARLWAIKERVDPDGLFVTHHGVGSERWSGDGFTRRT